MSSQTIQAILLDAQQKNIGPAKTLTALRWYMNQARVVQTNSSKMIREFDADQYRTSTQLMVGRMYYFFYDPKHKKTLPYYDTFPCIWILNIYNDGSMLGLNLHYLPYLLRAKLMDALLDLENNAKLQKNIRLNISYNILKSTIKSPYYKYAIKKYLFKHVRSKLIKINHEEWPVAAFLPVHSFQKKTAFQVWADTRKG